VRLTKPRVIELLLVTAVPPMILAQSGMPSLWLIASVVIGGALAAGGANTINCWIERDRDQLMRRTLGRPLPQGEIVPSHALWFGIVLNGSPLFTGGAGSGESEIRRYVLENDLVEAIIGLPTDMFYNTGIGTYVWIVSNRKPAARKGKVQLIDASSYWQKMRKSLGSKRKELSADHIEEITLFGGDHVVVRFPTHSARDVGQLGVDLPCFVCLKLPGDRRLQNGVVAQRWK
jgi:hypothetical protein